MRADIAGKTAWLLLIIVILLWGINWPIMKFALNFMGPITFAATRIVIATAVTFGYMLAMKRLMIPDRSHLPLILSVGVFQFGLHFLLMTFGLQYTEPGRSAILAYSTPLWVIPLALVFLRETLKGWKLPGVIIGFLGVVLLFHPTSFDWNSKSALIGHISLILSAIAWAISILLVKKLRWQRGPLDLAPWFFLTASCILVPAAILLEGSRDIVWTGSLAAILLYNGIVSTAFCFIAVVFINKALSAVSTSMGMLGVPVIGLVASAVAGQETVDAAKVISILLVISGIAMITAVERKSSIRTETNSSIL
ncbi:MAG TPA: DMT family transporter [Paenibacillaceae bacterium]